MTVMMSLLEFVGTLGANRARYAGDGSGHRRARLQHALRRDQERVGVLPLRPATPQPETIAQEVLGDTDATREILRFFLEHSLLQ
jgi:hypothetical protein